MPASAIGAVTDNDFVARLMKQVNAHPSAYPASDYKQITVSPTMMQSVIEMLTSTKMTETMLLFSQSINLYGRIVFEYFAKVSECSANLLVCYLRIRICVVISGVVIIYGLGVLRIPIG